MNAHLFLGFLLGSAMLLSVQWWWGHRRLRLTYGTHEYVRGERIARILATVFLIAAVVNVVVAA